MAGEFISVASLIAEASSTIKNFTEQEQQLAMQWAYTGLRKIGFSKMDIKTSDPMYLSDWSTAKPSDMGKLIDLALFDSAGKEIVIKYKGRAQVNTSAWVTGTSYAVNTMVIEDGVRYKCLVAHTAGTFATDLAAEKWVAVTRDARIHEDVRQYIGAIQVSEDDSYFNVEEFTDETPTGVYLVARYYAYPTDSNGYPKIPETHTLALMMYIRWMWSMRENKSLGEIQIAREVWLREMGAARGRMHTPTQLEFKETARTINSMIQKTVVRDRQY
jgi:hypothetical protein